MTRDRTQSKRRILPLAAIVGLCVVGAAAALVLVAGRDGGAKDASSGSTLLTAAELRGMAAKAATPVYWIGPRAGQRYELERRSDGAAFVRYVPEGEKGDSAAVTVVATYPMSNAFADVTAAGRRSGATRLNLSSGGIGVYTADRPTNVFVAYPGVATQVEVYDPATGAARAAVAAGRVRPVTPASAGTAEPFAANAGQLRRLAGSLHPAPVYWAGWKQGTRYEVTLTKDGTVYVRYLPSGVRAGDPRKGLLTVATYPRAGATAEVEAAGKRDGAVSFHVPSGGIAVYDRATPENVHLAYPDEAWQIEVYGSKGMDVASLVRSGKIVRVP